MDPKLDLHAYFANQAYSKDPVKSYQGYNLAYSDPFTKVYRSDIDKKQIVAVRGTDGFKDILLDAQLGLGKAVRDSDRYKRSEEVVKRYFDPRYNMEFTGHSLGGALSNELSKRFGANASLFNPYMNREGLSTNATIVKTSDDPLQVLNRLGRTDKIAEQMAAKIVDIGATGAGLGAHSIEQFLP